MKLDIRLSLLAEQDLLDIWRYIAIDDQLTATSFIDLLRLQILNLSGFPLSGVEREDVRAGLRLLVFKKYNIFYSVEGDFVLVSRILHGTKEVRTLFD